MSTTVKFKVCSVKPKLLPVSALGLLLLPLLCFSQQNKLIIQPPEPLTIKRGGSANQILKAAVLPGFHVNSDKPRDEFLIPLKLTWTSGPLEAQTTTYPQPEEIKVGDQNVTVVTGKFDLQTRFVAPANAPAGPATITGKLRYQACNNQMCFRPSSVDIRVPVSIE